MAPSSASGCSSAQPGSCSSAPSDSSSRSYTCETPTPEWQLALRWAETAVALAFLPLSLTEAPPHGPLEAGPGDVQRLGQRRLPQESPQCRHLRRLDVEAWWPPHAFLLGVLQKKMHPDQSKVCPEGRLGSRGHRRAADTRVNDVLGPGLVFGAGELRSQTCVLCTSLGSSPCFVSFSHSSSFRLSFLATGT